MENLFPGARESWGREAWGRGRSKEWNGDGTFLGKQDPDPRDGNEPASGQERRPGEKCSGAERQCSSVPAVTLGPPGSVEHPESREANRPGRPGQRGQAFGLQGGKEERGEREGYRGARKMLKMALDPAAGSAREEPVAAMTAASGGAGSLAGHPSRSPPSPFRGAQTPVKKGSQGASFQFLFYFKHAPSRC